MSAISSVIAWLFGREDRPKFTPKMELTDILMARITTQVEDSFNILVRRLHLGADLSAVSDRISSSKEYVDDLTSNCRDDILIKVMREIDSFIQSSNESTTEVRIDAPAADNAEARQ